MRKILLAALIIFAAGVAALPAWGSTTWYYDAIGANSGETDFFIATAADLEGLAQIVNAGTDDFSGKTITLNADADINLSGYLNWEPIGYSNELMFGEFPFAGVFDGGGNIISNLSINRQRETLRT